MRRAVLVVRMGLAAALTLAAAGASANDSPGRDSAASPPRHRSGLEGLPGYRIPPNPDSIAVRRGRRDAPRITVPFTGGAPGLEALGRAIVSAISRGDEQGLRALCITREEFERILWPEMPNSAPASGATADDAWYFLDHRLTGGVRSAIGDHQGRRLRYEGITDRLPGREFRNYSLVRGIGIAVHDSSAATSDTLTVVRTVARRQGRWKIYSMRD